MRRPARHRLLHAAAVITAVGALGAALLAAPGPAVAAQGAWSPGPVLSGTAAEHVRVATGADGTEAVAWWRWDTVAGRYQVEVATRAPGVAGFGPAQPVGARAEDYEELDVAVLPDGSVTVAWVAENLVDAAYVSTVLTSTRRAGSTAWSTPALLDTTYDVDYLTVRAGADGTTAISWVDFSENEVSTAVRRGSSGAWSTQVLESNDESMYELTTAVAPDGSVVSVWSNWSESLDDYRLKYRARPAGSSWTPVRSVRADDGAGEYSNIVVSPTGSFHLVWLARLPGESGDTVHTSTLSSVSASWTTPVTIGDDTANAFPAIAVTADGTSVVTWPAYDGSSRINSAVRRPGQAWGPATALAPGSDDHHTASGADGTVTTVWRAGSGTRVEAATLHPGATDWSSTVVLHDGDWAGDPRVGVASDGRATAAWETGDRVATASTTLPRPAVQPSVEGSARTGETVTCAPGGFRATTAAYQWLRGGKAVKGATGAERTLTSADHGKQVACRVTATNAAGSTTATSAAVTVKAGKLTLVKKPKVKGKAKVGKKLRATTGTWSAKPDKVTYRWFKGKKKVKGKAGKKKAYVVKRSDAGKKLRVKVTVKADGYAKASTKTKPKKVKRKK